jgi:excisionase family DNA binding protein
MAADFAIIGNTFTSTIPFIENLVQSAVKLATVEAVKQYKKEQLKDIVVSTKEAAEYLNCTSPTIIGYINEGHRNAGKLPAISTGKLYKINKYDLLLFKEKMIA